MGLTGFNRDRKKRLADKVGEELADELFGMGITDAEKLTRLDEVFGVLGTSEEKAKEIKKKVKDALDEEGSSDKKASKDEEGEGPKADNKFAELPADTDFPYHYGGGNYFLSDGSKVSGKQDAVEAQQELDEG